jgi:hypothetical protein
LISTTIDSRLRHGIVRIGLGFVEVLIRSQQYDLSAADPVELSDFENMFRVAGV